jgi:hypothetical protein
MWHRDVEQLFRDAGILELRRLYVFAVIKHALKHQQFSQLRVASSTRRPHQFFIDFIPHSTRMLQTYYVHLSKLTSNIPAQYMNLKSIHALKDYLLGLQSVDIETILAGPYR